MTITIPECQEVISFLEANVDQLSVVEFQQGLDALADYGDALEDLIDDIPARPAGVSCQMEENGKRYQINFENPDKMATWLSNTMNGVKHA
jgi:hypothetical protein